MMRLFRRISGLYLIEGPEPEIQRQIDTERALRSQSLRRVGDQYTEYPAASEGIAPAGVLTKENER